VALSFIKKIDKTRQQNKCIHCCLQECVKLGGKQGASRLTKRFHSAIYIYNTYIHIYNIIFYKLYNPSQVLYYTLIINMREIYQERKSQNRRPKQFHMLVSFKDYIDLLLASLGKNK